MTVADELKSSGLVLDTFGDTAIAIFEKPAAWDLNWAQLLHEIADEVRENGHSVHVPSLKVEAVDATAAGDTFCATSIHTVLKYGIDSLTEENLKELLTYANAAASLITTRKGALRVMPALDEVKLLAGTRL